MKEADVTHTYTLGPLLLASPTSCTKPGDKRLGKWTQRSVKVLARPEAKPELPMTPAAIATKAQLLTVTKEQGAGTL